MTPNLSVSLAGLLLAACSAPGPVAASAPDPGSTAAPVVSIVAPHPGAPGEQGGLSTLISAPRRDVAMLEQLLAGSAASSPDRPRLLRRLAEAYVALESAARRDQVEHEIGADAASRAGQPERAKREAGAAAAATKIVEAARDKAIATYTRLKDEHPRYCQGGADPARAGCGDEVLFYLAYEYEQARKPDEARKAYREIIVQWPASRYLPNAHLAFAEQLFEQAMVDPGKRGDAEKEYLEVLRYPPPDNKVAAYAHYKLGYVYWNAGDTARAVVEFTRAIEVSESTSSGSALAKTARRDVVSAYAVAGDPRKAHALFAKWSGDPPGQSAGLHRMLDQLGLTYLDTGKAAAVVELHLDWLDHGAGTKACEAATRIDAALAGPGMSPPELARLRAAAAASAKLVAARAQCAVNRSPGPAPP
jgi:tetratricopeptide (TPR) repeat protein